MGIDLDSTEHDAMPSNAISISSKSKRRFSCNDVEAMTIEIPPTETEQFECKTHKDYPISNDSNVNTSTENVLSCLTNHDYPPQIRRFSWFNNNRNKTGITPADHVTNSSSGRTLSLQSVKNHRLQNSDEFDLIDDKILSIKQTEEKEVEVMPFPSSIWRMGRNMDIIKNPDGNMADKKGDDGDISYIQEEDPDQDLSCGQSVTSLEYGFALQHTDRMPFAIDDSVLTYSRDRVNQDQDNNSLWFREAVEPPVTSDNHRPAVGNPNSLWLREAVEPPVTPDNHRPAIGNPRANTWHRALSSSPIGKKVMSSQLMGKLPPLPSLHKMIDETSEQTRALIRSRSDSFQDYLHDVLSNNKSRRLSLKPHEIKLNTRVISIPANHQYKFIWDVGTIFVTIISAYATHLDIRSRRFEFNAINIFTRIWFAADILLNFLIVEQDSDGVVTKNRTASAAIYLTTWFPIDILSICPWEWVFLRPVIEKQNRRKFLTKWFFRSRATVKVTRFLRGRHFKVFSRIAKNTKKIGYGAKKLVALLVRYVPKYLLFYRNMKTILMIRVLRQVNLLRKMYVNITNVPGTSAGKLNNISSYNENGILYGVNNKSTQLEYFIHAEEDKIEIALNKYNVIKMSLSQ